MIELKNLTVAFSDKIVLDNIDLTFRKNENTVIVGKSGCGKSVLVKTIAGLIIPVRGIVLIDGEDIFSLRRKALHRVRKKLAMLFQGAALLDSLNVYQNVALPLFEHTSLTEDQIYEIVSSKLAIVGLHGIHTIMPAELSGGMKKRVALARAIIMEPEYIIYDEPTTGLDPGIAAEITELIMLLQETLNVTSLVISHDLDFIEKISNRIVMINEKKIFFDGSFQDFKKARSKEIKMFIREI
ncbi:MAG: ATP-binding cassette domain-containing protein [Candidatus Cloacimonetes bacterium]|nr:ATP-binding cassette domain-containing protein [Candidatus Cloacimonadota bacterium]